MIEVRHMMEIDRVSAARQHLDAAEMWLRRLVHEELRSLHGDDYFREGVINGAIRKSAERVRTTSAGRITRDIDATSFEDLARIVANPQLHRTAFGRALEHAYPNGSSEAKTFLERLTDIRNSVHHGNGCTTRQLEQAVCYANDLIESLKKYYLEQNKDRMFNVPTVVRITDNRGNQAESSRFVEAGDVRVCDFKKSGKGTLLPGDTLVIEVEIDSSFEPESYGITWQVFGQRTDNTSLRVEHVVRESDVSQMASVGVKVISKKAWHKHRFHDDFILIGYSVLPPIDG